ncbi:Choline dehydrogenase [Dyadobacter sp. SG02]|uniref:GMC oxidoreductase n=1 Tax=Dyadobacter sp. SG02 TaxID=1855291 RepID=UPI0008C93083|nr:GMC oxidoreductase [Dyadobacter sp. SG02]SEJ39188.1 Choline dehydrogenase [Dyadobacter sp. SG02]
MNLIHPLNILYDLCIVGAGPAGIITALEYCRYNPGKKILLVEYGRGRNQHHNALDDSIKIDNPANHYHPYECTNKGLGGTSATWGGRCVMYDEIDFMERSVTGDDCTWGADVLAGLRPYLPKAAEYFECGEPIFNLKDIEEFRGTHIAEGFVEGIVTDSVVERWSMPTRFGSRYSNRLKKTRDIHVLQGFEIRDMQSPNAAGTVTSVKIRNVSTATESEVTAKRFVLAAGTQETTRALLRNKQLFKNLDSIPEALGHYYQGHISGKVASVVFHGNPQKTDYGFLKGKDKTYLRRRFQFTSNFLKEQNLLNTAIWLDNPLYYNPAHRNGAMSLMYLAMITPVLGKKLAPPAIAESITKGMRTGVKRHILNILRELPHSLTIPAAIFYKRYLLKRKLPGVFLFSPENKYALHFHAEQLPQYRNRMYLGEDRETLHIDYSLADEDIRSVIRTHEALDHWLRECGCGELQYWFGEDAIFEAIKGMSRDGMHQSGTTRMAESPARGVVDMDLKLWGTKNVYICSSSVYPTSGQANPTFLLGVFACRLAKHLTTAP